MEKWPSLQWRAHVKELSHVNGAASPYPLTGYTYPHPHRRSTALPSASLPCPPPNQYPPSLSLTHCRLQQLRSELQDCVQQALNCLPPTQHSPPPHCRLQQLRSELQDCVRRNEDAEELERVERADFVIDRALVAELKAEAYTRVVAVREAIRK